MKVGSLIWDDNLTGVSRGYLHHKYLTSYIGAQAWPEDRYSIVSRTPEAKKNLRTWQALQGTCQLFGCCLARWLMGCVAWTSELPYCRLIREAAWYLNYHAAAQSLTDATLGHRLTLHEFDDARQLTKRHESWGHRGEQINTAALSDICLFFSPPTLPENSLFWSKSGLTLDIILN